MVADGHYAFCGNYFRKPWTATLKRITYELLLIFINDGNIIYIILSLLVFRYLSRKSVLKLNQPKDFWLLVLVSMLLTSWLVSTSWRYYSPVSPLPRHFLMSVPPLCITAAFGWEQARDNRRLMIYYLLAFALVLLLALYLKAGKITCIYAGFVGWYIGSIFWIKLRLKPVINAGFWLLLLVHPIYSMTKPSITGYQDYRLLVEKYFVNDSDKTLVYTHELW